MEGIQPTAVNLDECYCVFFREPVLQTYVVRCISTCCETHDMNRLFSQNKRGKNSSTRIILHDFHLQIKVLRQCDNGKKKTIVFEFKKKFSTQKVLCSNNVQVICFFFQVPDDFCISKFFVIIDYPIVEALNTFLSSSLRKAFLKNTAFMAKLSKQ